jgi:segregation and condensation protein A
VDDQKDLQQQLPVAYLIPTPEGVAVPKSVEGLEVVLEMVSKGEVDPWDVDIVKVADGYLRFVQEEATSGQAVIGQQRPDEATLRRMGKALLYLAILLRMKSDLLSGLDPFARQVEDAQLEAFSSSDEIDWEAQFDADGFHAGIELDETEDGVLMYMNRPRSPFDVLSQSLLRRTSAKMPRARLVTLEDLIRELQRYDDLEEELSRQRRSVLTDQRRRKVRDYSQLSTEAIKEMAHEEFQEEAILGVLAVLKEAWLSEGLLAPSQEDLAHEQASGVQLPRFLPVPLNALAHEVQEDRATAYLSLLFLCAREHLDIRQDAWYDDTLQVGPWDPFSTNVEDTPPEGSVSDPAV